MKKMTFVMLILCLLCSFAFAEPAQEIGFLRIENGMLQPVLNWTELRDENYTNEGSDIRRFCVWVETDYDTDLDGKADLVRALVQVPRAAAEGRYKAAVIYNPTPYGAGTVERYLASIEDLYTKEYFDQSRFYEPCEKREPAGSMTTLEAAAQADPMTWNYRTPDAGNGTNGIGFSYAIFNMYYIIRGFAVVSRMFRSQAAFWIRCGKQQSSSARRSANIPGLAKAPCSRPFPSTPNSAGRS